MSRKKYECCEEKNTFLGNLGMGNCCCDFSTLIILILIILQFNRRGGILGGIAPVATDSSDCGPIAPQTYVGGFNLIDNSILFIIALFFLSCCNPCRK